ncbi:MAG TPA: pyridine nucleotide-disulfide oxidoreductase [Spirochaetia bacterium]|nr:pyridine nucleotide-disulfide oxidoreductase [Spirochaetia bacterium]
MKERFDLVIVGTGPAGLGAAFAYREARPADSVLLIDRSTLSTGGLCNDCKMNFTYPIGFPLEYWEEQDAERRLGSVREKLQPVILSRHNLGIYATRAQKLGVSLLEVRQSHLGTDGGIALARDLKQQLERSGASVSLGEKALDVREPDQVLVTDRREIRFGKLVIAPGRKGFAFLQKLMDSLSVAYVDNVVDIGLRLETREGNYPIVRDYYDPKFHFPQKVRTFCTNSGRAFVVKEKYEPPDGSSYFSVNGHAFSRRGQSNGLVNFALLKTVRFTEPLASGQEFARMLGQQAMLMGGGQPLMQRVGDFRLGKRSKKESFNEDLYDFAATLSGCTPGDIALAMPSKILRAIWRSMKLLDTIIPGVLHPSTIMYYPEIKLYGNRPRFIDGSFQARPGIWMIGDGAGTSRGITAAWASGIRAVEGMMTGAR